MRKILTLLLVVFSFILAIAVFSIMPARVASHWNSAGEADGYMNKFWGVFLMPIIVLGLYLLFIFLPKLDPLKKNVKKFQKYFDWFILLMISFMLYIYILTIAYNMGYKFNMTVMMLPALGFLFYYVGVLIEKSKRNWFIGIRTPWTLSSDIVWRKTHDLGARLFKIAGVIAIIGAFFGELSVYFVIFPVLIAGFVPVVYSYAIRKN